MTHDPLCEELGFDQPAGHLPQEPLGTATFGDGSWIEVCVHDTHVRHWTLLVYCADRDDVVRLECGSGELAEYWPFAVALAEGMVRVFQVIDSLKDEVQEAVDALPLPPDRRYSLYRTLGRKFAALGEDGKSLRRGATQMAWDARREMRQHPAE